MNFINKILNMLPDFDFTDDQGNTILHQAVMENNIDMVISLLEKMKESNKNIIDSQNNDGNTAFHLAILNENNEIAQILDDAGADKSIRNNSGEFVEDITEDEYLEEVNFRFPTMKCSNSNSNFDPAILKMLNHLSKLNDVPQLIVHTNFKPKKEKIYEDIILDKLLNTYLNQKGGNNKKLKITGSRKLK
jgi:ankyrin repeat protein